MPLDVAKLAIEIDSRDARAASDDLDRLTRSSGPAEKGVRGVGRAGVAAGTGMSRFTGGIVATVAGLATLTAAMSVARGAIGRALPFDAALAEASTLIEGTTEQMDEMTAAARRMSLEFGTNATEQVRGFYQAISAGAGTVSEASELLNEANKFAVGGVTSLVTSVDVLTTATNAYAQSNLTAADAADTLFVGIKAGKTTATELGASIGNVASIAAQAGLRFDELVAGVAALTASGIQTTEAVTGMRAILASLLKPTQEAVDTAKSLGLEFNTTALRAKGFSAFMEDIIEKTGGSQEQLALLFGGVRALGPILAFAGAAGDKFNETMDLMADRAGAAQEANDKIAASLEKRLSAQLTIVDDKMLSLGTTLLEVIVPAMEAVTSSAETLGTVLAVLAATQLPRLAGALVTVTASLLGTATALGGATLALGALRTALTILGGPLGLLAGAAVLIYTNWDKLRGLIPEALGGGISAAERLETATDNLVIAIGDEIKQTQLLSGVLGTSTILSADAARQKLVEAKARYENVTAAIAEQRALAIGSERYAQLTEQIRQAQNVVEATGFGAIDASSRFRADAFEMAQQRVASLLLQRQGLLEADSRLTDSARTAAENIAILTRTLESETDGMIALNGAIVEPIARTERLGVASAEAAAETLDVVAALREEILLLSLTSIEQEKYNALKEAGVTATSAQGAEIISLVDRLDRLRDAQARREGANNVIEGLEEELMLLKLTNEEQEKYNLLKQAGVSSTSALGAEIIDLADRLHDAYNEQERLATITGIAQNAFDSLFNVIATGSGNAAQALRNLGLQFLKLAANQLFMKLIGSVLGGAFGGGGGGFTPPIGSPTSAGPFGNGEAFLGGNVIPFAKGGIVSEPTFFPMANGMGLMSENEPEAVMPLKRGPNGRLGVESSGGGPNVTVQIINNTPAQIREEQTTGPNGEDVRRFIIDEVGRAMGRGEFDQQQRSRFGIAPQRVRR